MDTDAIDGQAKLATATAPTSSNFPPPNQQPHLLSLAAPCLPRSSPWPLTAVSPTIAGVVPLRTTYAHGQATLGSLRSSGASQQMHTGPRCSTASSPPQELR